MNVPSPLISIGLPIYQSEQTIRTALDSILSQTFTDFELLISDNASTDGTALICQAYAARDSRIRYIRQPQNLGAAENFKFVFAESRGVYFVWMADDDIRSPNFLEVNAKFLSENSEFVACTSPNGFENWSSQRELVNFDLSGDEVDRYISFFNHSFVSHGLFYSLIRAQTLRDCEIIDQIFPGFDWLGFDWAIVLYLAGKGKLGRTTCGYTIFGVQGISSHADVFKKFNTTTIEWFLPFYRFSKLALSFTRHFTISQRIQVILRLLKLNLYANWEPIRSRLYFFSYGVYRIFIKPLLKIWHSWK